MLGVRDSIALRSLYPFVLNYFAPIPAERRAGVRVLDLPAGAGVLSAPLAAAGFDVTPADLFPETLTDSLRRHADAGAIGLFEAEAGVRMPSALRKALVDGRSPTIPKLEAVQADMEARLPFADASFDVALCVEGIEHVVDRHRTLQELRRVVGPGGKLIMTTPNLLSLRPRVAYLAAGQRAFKSYIDEYTSVWGRSPDGARTYHGHAFLLNYFQLRYSMHHCGLRITRLLNSNWSVSSLALTPLAAVVAAGTKASQGRAVKRFERYRQEGRLDSAAQPPYAEMFRHLLSPAMLYNATLIVEAEAV